MRKPKVTEKLAGLPPGDTLNLHVRTVSPAARLVEKLVEWSHNSTIRHTSVWIYNDGQVKLPSTPLSPSCLWVLRLRLGQLAKNPQVANFFVVRGHNRYAPASNPLPSGHGFVGL